MKYSKKEITRAGNTLMTSKSKDEVNHALIKINDWRANHLQPLKVMKRSLLKTLEKHNIIPYLISQRLKRLTSIEYKLDLNINMGLGGMQDIGGYRAVLDSVQNLSDVKKLIELTQSTHKLVKVNDYIQKPKPSGYRSIHFIYNYHSNVEKYNGLKVELQVRTKLQHYWATTVETAGIITKTSLKSSQGPDEWLEFFKIVSSLFAIKEQLPVLDEHIGKTMKELMVECYNYCDKLRVIDTLLAIKATTRHLEKEGFPGDYYLLNIDIEEEEVGVTVFSKSRYAAATDAYLAIERDLDNNKQAVVLVSATSFKSLRQAYPSYFLDTSAFVKALETMNRNCVKRGYFKSDPD